MAKVALLATPCKEALRQLSVSASGGEFQNPARRLSGTLCAALSALLACPASSATWEIVPTLSAGETFTDNVRLSAAGSERSDWVTTLTPGLAIRASGDRLRLDAVYSPQVLYRAREGSNDVFHLLNANGTAEFIKRTLFLDVRSTVSQENISLLGPQTDSNVNITGNRTSVRSSLIGPVLRHDFGLDALGEARYSFSTVNTGSATALLDSRATNLDVKLASGPIFRLLRWSAAYQRQHIDYDQPQVQDIDTHKFSAGAKRQIAPQVGLLANVGYEDHSYATTGPAPKGAFWNAGAEWTPTPRTRLAATTGRNYLGSTHSLDFNHRTRRTVWTANYSQDITTTRTQVLAPTTVDTAGYLDALFQSNFPDQAARQSAVNTFIARSGLPSSFGVPSGFFTGAPFLVKRLQGSIGLQGVRNTVLANAFAENREALAPGPPGEGEFALSQRTRQTGASVLWTTVNSAQTSSTLSVGTTRTEFVATGREDIQKFIRFGIVHQFHPRLSGTLNFRRLKSVSTQGEGTYLENAVSAALIVRF